MKYLLSLFLLFSLKSLSQCKSFELSDRGDTLNCIDKNNKKQGKWIVKTPALRGNPAQDEEGVFKNNLKEGPWRMYNGMGDLLAVENYRWGFKDGKQFYYTILGLAREESWKAKDPEKEYDTIDVPDLFVDGKYERKIIKLEGSTVKHGFFRFYEPASGFVIRQEEYFMDQLQKPGGGNAANGGAPASDSTKKKKIIPAEVLQYEKNNSKKKKIKVRDGRTF